MNKNKNGYCPSEGVPELRLGPGKRCWRKERNNI